MKFAVMSRENCKKWCYQKHVDKSLIISISDNWAAPNKVFESKDNRVVDILRLYFDDIDCERRDLFHGMTDADAQKIADFIAKHKANFGNSSESIQKIIVHCNAGVSRSAGVCAAISKYLTGDDEAFFAGGYRPNMFCYSKVLKALYEQSISNIEK